MNMIMTNEKAVVNVAIDHIEERVAKAIINQILKLRMETMNAM
jgi:hypothetical protein